jgi:hypothetical protein
MSTQSAAPCSYATMLLCYYVITNANTLYTSHTSHSKSVPTAKVCSMKLSFSIQYVICDMWNCVYAYSSMLHVLMSHVACRLTIPHTIQSVIILRPSRWRGRGGRGGRGGRVSDAVVIRDAQSAKTSLHLIPWETGEGEAGRN